MNDNPIIVALDVETAAEARGLVARLGARAGFYKVGLEMFTGAGPEFVRELLAEGKQVFLDLKLYDISETVKRSVAQAARLGARFLTVHAVGAAMRAAVEGRASSDLKLLAVTVLTSFTEADLKELGYHVPVAELVDTRARQARECGIDGIVCSPREVARVSAIHPQGILVTPGVRSAGSAAGDQKRVATPAEAIRNGADYLVMGRQITRAADPASELARVLEEIAAPLQ